MGEYYRLHPSAAKAMIPTPLPKSDLVVKGPDTRSPGLVRNNVLASRDKDEMLHQFAEFLKNYKGDATEVRTHFPRHNYSMVWIAIFDGSKRLKVKLH